MTDFDDDTLVPPLSGRDWIDQFRSSLDAKGDVVQKRRAFLATLLGTAGLAVTDGIVQAASAEASTIERNPGARGALEQLSYEIHQIARSHMEPGQNPNELLSKALAAWRDATALRHVGFGASPLIGKALEAEAVSAGLVAQFLGDRGEHAGAESWYHAALKVAPTDDTRSWLYACRAWLYLYEGDVAGAKKNSARAAGIATYYNHDRAAFAYHQLARSYALDGNHESAREHLSNATHHFLHSKNTGDALARPSLLNWTLLQNAQYSMDTLAILAYAEGRDRDVTRFQNYADLVTDQIGHFNGMNSFLGRISIARVKASGPNPDLDSAVEEGMNAISNLRLVDRQTAVVQGKAQQFADDLKVKFGDCKPVRAMSGFVGELTQAA